MPVVLTSNDVTRSGHKYADFTGRSYEYPRIYWRRIRPGERFVYYQGSVSADSRRRVPSYFGTGVIGKVYGSGALLRCTVLDYVPFSQPVPFRDSKGNTLEPGGEVGGRYYQAGVRQIDEVHFARILSEAAILASSEPPLPASGGATPNALGRYASPAVAAAVEIVAVDAAVDFLRTQLPGVAIHVQPHSNPGFDVEVIYDGRVLYVEVKGTQAAVPQFFMSSGEQAFSLAHSNEYRVIVVTGIDLRSCTHGEIHEFLGQVDEERFSLTPTQYAVRPRAIDGGALVVDVESGEEATWTEQS